MARVVQRPNRSLNQRSRRPVRGHSWRLHKGPFRFPGLFPSVRWLILITAILGIFAANVENLYGPFLSGAAAISPSGRVGSAPVARFLTAAAVAILGTLLAILAS